MARTRTLFPIALLTALAVASTVAPGASAATVPRVIGGAPPVAGEAPWSAALVAGNARNAFDGQFCGGTVVAARAVLTAAHCVLGVSPSRVDVVTGRSRLSSPGGERIPVSAVRLHPHYDPRRARGDVAVLLLSRPTTAPALTLAGREAADAALVAPRAPLSLYGWGGVANVAGSHSDDLRAGGMAAVSWATCESDWRELFDARVQLCAVGPSRGAPDACPGDSGGPLVGGRGAARRLAGVVSFGASRCGDPKAPTVFTRVSSYAGWILAQAYGAPPGGGSRVTLRVADVRCAATCLVDVDVSGEDVGAVAALDVRVRSARTDRVYPAAPIGARRWRARVGRLPLGRVRVVTTALRADGRPIGRRAKVTVTVAAP